MIKRDASSEVVLNQLYRFADLQTTFGVNMLALNSGRPEQMNLKAMIGAFAAFREEVVTRRTRFDLSKARDRGHTLLELAIAWLLARPAVASVIAGATKPEQAQANAAAGAWTLTDDDLRAVDAAIDAAKSA